MKTTPIRVSAAGSLAIALLASSCAYPPAYFAERYYTSAPEPPMVEPVGGGYETPEPAPPPAPGYAGVDPGLVIAGIAAAGLIGYAIADHSHGCGPAYCGPVVYGGGFYGPCY